MNHPRFFSSTVVKSTFYYYFLPAKFSTLRFCHTCFVYACFVGMFLLVEEGGGIQK